MSNPDLRPILGEILKKISTESQLTEGEAFYVLSDRNLNIDQVVEKVIYLANKGVHPIQIRTLIPSLPNNYDTKLNEENTFYLRQLYHKEIDVQQRIENWNKKYALEQINNPLVDMKYRSLLNELQEIKAEERSIFLTDIPTSQSVLEKKLAIKNEADEIRKIASSDYGLDLKSVSNDAISIIIACYLKVSSENYSINGIYEYGPPHSGNSRGFYRPA